MKILISGTLIAIILTFSTQLLWAQSEEFNLLIEKYYKEKLSFNPIEATSNGIEGYDHLIANSGSQQYLEESKAFFIKYKDLLSEFGSQSLDKEDQLSYKVMNWDIEINLELAEHPTYLLPVNQMFSLPISFAQLGSGSSVHKFESLEDYQEFMNRMKGFIEWTDTAIQNMKEGVRKGYVQPRIIVERVITQYGGLIKDEPDETIFYRPLTALPSHISEDEKELLLSEYKELIMDVMQSYEKLTQFLEDEYLPSSRENYGLIKLQDGEALYRSYIKFWTTRDLDPDSLHQVGLEEMDRIDHQLDRIVKIDLKFNGSVLDYVQSAPESNFPYSTSEEVIQGFLDIQKRVEVNLGEYFDLKPKTPFEVREVESFRLASASASYSKGTPDGSVPGIFYIPIRDPKQFSILSMESLFLHEAIPGHHYQISLQQEMESLPDLRRYLIMSAFVEGWGLYVEGLGYQLGLYKDPRQRIGRLGSERLRAIRLVVDTGLHAKGWSREKAISYMMEKGFPETFAANQIDRYLALPGQALSYKVGEMTLLEMRRKAKKELGDDFSYREFHRLILTGGSLPLSVLVEEIEKWIDRKK